MTASTVASAGTIASVVMSPARPRSSSNAVRTIGSMISRIVDMPPHPPADAGPSLSPPTRGEGIRSLPRPASGERVEVRGVRARQSEDIVSPHRQHALDRAPCPLGDRRVDGDLVSHGFEAVPDLWQGDPLHMWAEVARPHEFEIGVL